MEETLSDQICTCRRSEAGHIHLDIPLIPTRPFVLGVVFIIGVSLRQQLIVQPDLRPKIQERVLVPVMRLDLNDRTSMTREDQVRQFVCDCILR